MITKKYFELLHHLMIFILPIIFTLVPLIYIKYIAWIPLAISFSWVIFNGCVINTFHHKKANINTTYTDNVTPILRLLSKTIANYINKKYLQNTNRVTYIMFFYFILLTTIVSYRVIYNIEIL